MVIYVCTTITIRSCRECLGREQKIVHSTKYYSNVAWSGFSDFAAKTPAFQQSIAAVALDSSHRFVFQYALLSTNSPQFGKTTCFTLSLSFSLSLTQCIYLPFYAFVVQIRNWQSSSIQSPQSLAGRCAACIYTIYCWENRRRRCFPVCVFVSRGENRGFLVSRGKIAIRK